MKTQVIKPASWMLAFFAVFAVLYSLVVAGIGAVAFPKEAGGSLLVEGGKVRGSLLVGQDFSHPDRFHARPSAVGYDPRASGASNLGPTSAVLAKAIAERREALLKENGAAAGEPPADLLLASGSGLDPDISPRSALYQVPRIASSLGLGASGEAELAAIVGRSTRGRTLGFMGEPRVNVLELNLELERSYGGRP